MRLRELHVGETMHPLDQGLRVYGGVYSIEELREPFLRTQAAQLLSEMGPRFKNYWWPDLDRFQEFFGDDVDPVKHGPYQARTVGIPMVEAQRTSTSNPITEELAHALVAHDVQHDDHEGEFEEQERLEAEQESGLAEQKIKHDTPYAEQTVELKIKEYGVWKKLQEGIFGPDQFKKHLARVADFADPVAPNTFGKRLWDTNEAIGYSETLLRAWHVANNSDDITTEERRMSQRLAVEVSGRQIHRIEAVRAEIVYADNFLLGFAGQLREIKRAREAA